VRQAHEAVVQDQVVPESSDRHAHAAAGVTVKLRLRAVFFIKIRQEGLRRAGKVELLRPALESLPELQDFLPGGFLCEGDEDGGQVAVRLRDAMHWLVMTGFLAFSMAPF